MNTSNNSKAISEAIERGKAAAAGEAIAYYFDAGVMLPEDAVSSNYV